VILVSVTDHDGPRTFSFESDQVVIGRGPEVDLVLDQEGVAPRHIRVRRRGDELVVEDLRPRVPKQLERPVRPRDQIIVGGISLQLARCELIPEGITDAIEQRLLDDIRRQPSDAATRAVYADWLEERGELARAEFLREQLSVGGAADASDPSFVRASARLAQLASRVGDGWRARVAMSFIEGCRSRWPGPLGTRPGIGFELVCPMRWDRLEPTDREGIRTCGVCKSEVMYCSSIEQAATAAQDGRCIAVDPRTVRSPYDLDGPMMVGRPSPPLSRYGPDRRRRPPAEGPGRSPAEGVDQ